ncbi:LPS export ABC transporter periplasmic protein LptC [Flavobacteriaceae bacterium]|nr:LPS export ABC transporter periplasmic protein LptC [Flavobacteriaceae bacterium]MDA8947709.1 LPS export ABC transporter periplasmic protein LptC [Flavobacteriaceae bacterium]
MNFTKFLKGLLVITIALFVSCADSTQALNEINSDRQEPLGTAWNIRMIYTDSIKIQAILTAPKHIDYTNLSFRYAEFPEGLKVVFYDDLERENEVIADYGILYNDTKLIDLKGNVRLQSHDGSLLTTNQLFWDTESEWLFTEKPFRFEDSDYNFDALRLDTNKEFTKFQTGSLIGTVKVSEEKDTLEQQ